MTQLQEGISTVHPTDYSSLVEVWEASVRATHHFVTEQDIQVFRPIVRDALQHLNLGCVRVKDGSIAGFIAVSDGNVHMLFIHPTWRGQKIGSRLLRYAVEMLDGTTLDVNEQNEQAVGFYLHMGFEVIGRSERDSTDKPYPILHMRLSPIERTDQYLT